MEGWHTFTWKKSRALALAALLLVSLGTTATAAVVKPASGGGGEPFKNGDLFISVVGLGLAGADGTSSTPSIGVEVEKAIAPEWSVGGVVGYSSSEQKYNYYYGEYGWKYTYVLVAARGGYHFVKFIKSPKLDAYAGLTLGYNHVTVKDVGNGLYSNYFTYKASGSYVLYGAHVGGRYFFNPNLAAQLELGYGIGYLSAGLCWKF